MNKIKSVDVKPSKVIVSYTDGSREDFTYSHHIQWLADCIAELEDDPDRGILHTGADIMSNKIKSVEVLTSQVIVHYEDGTHEAFPHSHRIQWMAERITELEAALKAQDDSVSVPKELMTRLEQSLPDGILLGNFNEPLDAYGKRILRVILVEFDRAILARKDKL